MTKETLHENLLLNTELGKKTGYPNQYSSDYLLPIPRQTHRDNLGISLPLPFHGHDYWNAYELSWLNQKGKPIVAIGEFIFPCTSPYLIESKSFKLYLNSFNNTSFNSTRDVINTMRDDLSSRVQAPVLINTRSQSETQGLPASQFEGICLDALDVSIDSYMVNADYLTATPTIVRETLYSDLLKSNCPVTGQPDWASVQITYQGPQIDHGNLLKYLVSYRNHSEFHEQCVERIFMDIMRHCRPAQLFVEARYTRRGGLDINPYRSTEPEQHPTNKRLWRQ